MDDIVLFVFRRDHRVHDNTALIETIKRANANSWKILPAFIFNPRQVDPTLNAYYSSNCVQFMTESLRDLQKQLEQVDGKLYCFHGEDSAIFDGLSERYNIKAVASNKDVTPFAIKRDGDVQRWCDKKGIDFISVEDYTMYPIEQVRTNQGKPFEIYTPFYRRAIRIPVPDPHSIPDVSTGGFVKDALDFEVKDIGAYHTHNEHLEQKGGRDAGLEILDKIRTGSFRKYKKDHDFPIKDATTRLGAYLKFGCVSIREAFKEMKDSAGKASLLVGQLYYREFYYHVAYHFPEILKGQVGDKSTPMHGRYEKADWNTDEEQLEKWKTGQTGFPIVDAAMRCLNKTGWLHGRMRMMVAMFLVRDLNIDWRVGERYMATQLVDYDPASNSQGWCWVLSFRRKFNPYKVAGKYDAQVEYIKKWVPELVDVPVLDLICWWEKVVDHPDLPYPQQMVDIQGYRVKFKTYIPDYVRPKDPNYKKTPKKSKYGNNKNTEKYNKNKERNKLLKQQNQGGLPNAPLPHYTQPPPPPRRPAPVVPPQPYNNNRSAPAQRRGEVGPPAPQPYNNNRYAPAQRVQPPPPPPVTGFNAPAPQPYNNNRYVPARPQSKFPRRPDDIPPPPPRGPLPVGAVRPEQPTVPDAQFFRRQSFGFGRGSNLQRPQL